MSKMSKMSTVLELSITDLLERRITEVLHVKVRDANGRLAHIHFSLGVTNNGRIKAEVTAATGPRVQSSKSVVANWREPVNLQPSGDSPIGD